jgi:carbonic anhydrase
MNDLNALIKGFNAFRREYRRDADGKYQDLSNYGPHSRILMIACCDSRVDPAIITNSSAGELMVVRNIGNLVPPYGEDSPFQETHASLEFAACYLELEHIIVMGHSRCGGIRSLLTRMIDDIPPSRPLDRWMAVAEPAAQQVLQEMPGATLDEQSCSCSRKALASSLENLRGYPWVRQRIERSGLQLHGWYFNLANGELESYDESRNEFAAVTAVS